MLISVSIKIYFLIEKNWSPKSPRSPKSSGLIVLHFVFAQLCIRNVTFVTLHLTDNFFIFHDGVVYINTCVGHMLHHIHV